MRDDNNPAPTLKPAQQLDRTVMRDRGALRRGTVRLGHDGTRICPQHRLHELIEGLTSKLSQASALTTYVRHLVLAL